MAPPREKKKGKAAGSAGSVGPDGTKAAAPKANGKSTAKGSLQAKSATRKTKVGNTSAKRKSASEQGNVGADKQDSGAEDESTDASDSNFHDADGGGSGPEDELEGSRESLTEGGHGSHHGSLTEGGHDGSSDPTRGAPSQSTSESAAAQAVSTDTRLLPSGRTLAPENDASTGQPLDGAARALPEPSAAPSESPALADRTESVAPAPAAASLSPPPIPQTPDPSVNAGGGVSPMGGKRSLWGILSQSGSSQGASLSPTAELRPKLAASLSSGLSSLSAGLSAVRRGSATPAATERVRLPRREVNEAQLAEDVMRFADARHVLRTETDGNTLRDLGIRLEEGWREKLAEAQSLRARLEEAQDTLADLEDENEHLRTQLGTLSEQIAAREDAFEQFQRSTIEQQAREKSLWREEAREEKENVLFRVAEAQRQVAQERAVVAQLKLLLQSVKSGRVDVLDKIDLGNIRTDAGSAGSEAQGDEVTQARASQASEPQIGEKGADEVQDDILFNLSNSPNSSKRSTSVFNDLQNLQEMKASGLLTDPSAEGVEEKEGKTYAIGTQILFDKAAADGALTKALQEENASLRSYIDAKDRRCLTLQQEVEQLQLRLSQTESAVAELLESAAPA